MHIENDQIKIFTILHPKDLTKISTKNIQQLLQVRKSRVKKTKLKLFWSGGKVPHRFLFGSLEDVDSFCAYLLNTNEKIKFISDEMQQDQQNAGSGKLAMIEQLS